jgi:hypothetical protein
MNTRVVIIKTTEDQFTHHGGAVVHVVVIMVSVSTEVHDTGGAGKGSFFDRTAADAALHALIVEGRHVEEGVRGETLEQRPAGVGEVIDPGLEIIFLIKYFNI